MPSLLCMENITGVEETQVKGFKCIKISTNIRDNRDHILRAEVSWCWNTVNSRLLSPGPIHLVRGFGWAYKGGSLYPGEFISGIKKIVSK